MSEPSLLRIIPLGGLGEFGMNIMVYAYGDDLIVVDCGMMFPDAGILGVDAVIPDMTWLFERADDVRAIFLTHGHEDHIGATPFLLEKVKAPVYGTPLTVGFVRDKLREFDMLDQADVRLMTPREIIDAGPFKVEPIHVTHSIVDAVALAIRTPRGTIIHTGDFKIDQTPVDGKPTDLSRIAAYGEEGVLLLVSDSTNAVYEGYSKSERRVSAGLDRIFGEAKGRIVVTTFASHIHRIQQIVDLTKKHKRKIYFLGRSVVDNVDTAERLGWMHIPRSVRPSSAKTVDEAPMQTVIVTTGTQGEPSSALARIALNEHKAVQLEPGDTVIISARTIPGNERAVTHVIDHIYRRGAEVRYDDTSDIHVSGHGLSEELKLMINLARPQHFVPMHGTLRHLVHHARLAEATGIRRDRIMVITNGEVIEIDDMGARIASEGVPTGKVFVDQQFEEVAGIVVRDRQHLAEDGFVIVVAALDRNGKLAREPEIITRGFVHVDESGDILNEVRELLTAMFSDSSAEELRDAEIVQEKMRSLLKRYFRKTLNRRPMILPVVWEM
ncbi:MAG: ribonuclease J [Thermoanaerobaculia bacterium]